jgi:hypothetical protein
MTDKFQSKTAEMMRKVLTISVGTFFLTEESLRGLISEFKLPKDLLSSILESANKSKGEFFRSFSKEIMAQVLERVDLSSLIQEILSKNEINLEVKVTFSPKNKDKKQSL